MAAYLITVAVCVALAICASNAMADPLTDDFAAKYVNRTVEPSAIASDRTITFMQDAPVRCV